MWSQDATYNHHCETTKRLHIDILELVDTSPFLAYNSTPIKGPTERHCFLAVGLLWASVQAQPWSTRMVKPTHFGWNSGTCCSSCGSLGGGAESVKGSNSKPCHLRQILQQSPEIPRAPHSCVASHQAALGYTGVPASIKGIRGSIHVLTGSLKGGSQWWLLVRSCFIDTVHQTSSTWSTLW